MKLKRGERRKRRVGTGPREKE
jgi:hypothetical protein